MSLFKKYLWVLVAILVFILDRITKHLVLNYLSSGESIHALPILDLIFTLNPGAAFGFLNKADGWQEWLFGAVAIGVSIFLVAWQFKISVKHLWLKIANALILGGTLGNLYDRVIYHSVIDFLVFYFKNWHYPAFNIADSAICIGATMLIIDILKQKEKPTTANT